VTSKTEAIGRTAGVVESSARDRRRATRYAPMQATVAEPDPAAGTS
jgi:hypothetical protein